METEEVRPKPVPILRPLEPVVSRTREDQADRFDDDGVFRAVLSEDTNQAAILTLLRVWGTTRNRVPETFKMSDGDQFMAAEGFATYRFPTDLQRVRLLDYPCLILGHWTHGTAMTYAVLVNLTDRDATVLDPLNGKMIYSLDVLQTLWGKEATVYWKRFPGIALPLKSKGVDPSVKTIQKALKVQGLYLGKPDGVLGSNTKRAIRFFQQKYGLKDSSVFNLESYLTLSKVMFKETPGLQMDEL
jgi:hypothetical protein